MAGPVPARTQRMMRVIPVAFLMYTIAFMDRNNLGIALPTMEKQLGFDPAVAGLASGIFFIGYLVLQIPGGHLAERWSAKWIIFTLLLVWGVFAMLTGAVQNVGQLLVIRFLLGLTEGGVWPATLVLLSHWFPQEERARANNLWMLCLPVASAVATPIGGLVLGASGGNFRLLFLLEGIPPLVWAAVWAMFIKDRPEQADWLAESDRQALLETLAAEREQSDRADLSSYRRAFLSPAVWLFVLIYFFSTIPGYAIASFFPSYLQSHGLSIVATGFVSALPWIACIVGLIAVGILSDRTRARRAWIAIPFVVVGVGIFLSILVGNSVAAFVVVLSLAGLGLYAYLGPFWACVEQVLPPQTAGGGMGFVNALGNLGGFAGPYVFGLLLTSTGGFGWSFAFLGASALIMAALTLLIRVREGSAASAVSRPSTAS